MVELATFIVEYEWNGVLAERDASLSVYEQPCLAGKALVQEGGMQAHLHS